MIEFLFKSITPIFIGLVTSNKDVSEWFLKRDRYDVESYQFHQHDRFLKETLKQLLYKDIDPITRKTQPPLQPYNETDYNAWHRQRHEVFEYYTSPLEQMIKETYKPNGITGAELKLLISYVFKREKFAEIVSSYQPQADWFLTITTPSILKDKFVIDKYMDIAIHNKLHAEIEKSIDESLRFECVTPDKMTKEWMQKQSDAMFAYSAPISQLIEEVIKELKLFYITGEELQFIISDAVKNHKSQK